MWQVEIEEYNRMAQDSFPAEREYFRREYFRDFYEALRFIEEVKSSNCNCSIWLTELYEDPENPGDYMDTDNVTCYQEISFG